MKTPSAVTKLERYIRARYPIIGVASHEESRVLSSIKLIAGFRNRHVYTWSITRGIVNAFDDPSTYNPAALAAFEGTQDIAAALQILSKYDEDAHPALFVFLDLHPYLGDPMIVRFLRDIAARFELCRHNLILVSPNIVVPPDLDKTLVILDWPLPTEEELASVLDQAERDLPASIPVTLNGNRPAVIAAMRGLTLFEAANVLTAAIAATGELGDDVIPYIVSEKKQIVRKAGLLEFFEADVTMDQVGGLPHLKHYADVKRRTFSDQARQFGVEPARGVLLLGLPGTGKSLTAKAIAGGQLPLLRMDVGALMGQYVGQSEGNVRGAFKVAEAIAPCVLWLDEIEKALGGSGENDGGTTNRVVGSILTFMQETLAPIYFVATANDVRSLRPELINRFDDVFFVDLPNRADRAEIVSIHLQKRGRGPLAFDLLKISDACHGLVGREIERVVRSALELAFYQGCELTTQHLVDAAGKIVPLSAIMDEQIKALRSWADNRAIRANDPVEVKPTRAQDRSARTADL
jgi:AAA+ superfamily predicted ATPase